MNEQRNKSPKRDSGQGIRNWHHRQKNDYWVLKAYAEHQRVHNGDVRPNRFHKSALFLAVMLHLERTPDESALVGLW